MSSASLMADLLAGSVVSVGGKVLEMDADGDVVCYGSDGTVSKAYELDVNGGYEVLDIRYTIPFGEAADMALDGATIQCELDPPGRWAVTEEGFVRTVSGKSMPDTISSRCKRSLWRIVSDPMPFIHKPVRSGERWLDAVAKIIDGNGPDWQPTPAMGAMMTVKGIAVVLRDSEDRICFFLPDGSTFATGFIDGGASFVSSAGREIRAVEFADDAQRPRTLFDVSADVRRSEFRIVEDGEIVCYGIAFRIDSEMEDWMIDHPAFSAYEEECE